MKKGIKDSSFQFGAFDFEPKDLSVKELQPSVIMFGQTVSGKQMDKISPKSQTHSEFKSVFYDLNQISRIQFFETSGQFSQFIEDPPIMQLSQQIKPLPKPINNVNNQIQTRPQQYKDNKFKSNTNQNRKGSISQTYQSKQTAIINNHAQNSYKPKREIKKMNKDQSKDISQENIYNETDFTRRQMGKRRKELTREQKIPNLVSFYFPCKNISKYFPVKLRQTQTPAPRFEFRLGNKQKFMAQVDYSQEDGQSEFQDIEYLNTDDSSEQEVQDKNQQAQKPKQILSGKNQIAQMIELEKRQMYKKDHNQKDIATQTQLPYISPSNSQILLKSTQQKNNIDNPNLIKQNAQSKVKFDFSDSDGLNKSTQTQDISPPKSYKLPPYSIQSNKHSGQMSNKIVNKFKNPTLLLNKQQIKQIWGHIHDNIREKDKTPSQLASLNQDLFYPWNQLLVWFQNMSSHMKYTNNPELFFKTIYKYKNQIYNRYNCNLASRSSKERIQNVLQYFAFQTLVIVDSFWGKNRDIRLMFTFFLGKDQNKPLFPAFIKFTFNFLFKRYLLSAYNILSATQTKPFTILSLILCVDLLFKHSINKAIDKFFAIQRVAAFDERIEKEVIKLTQLLADIKSEGGYFSQFFYSKDFPFLGYFVQSFQNLNKSINHLNQKIGKK